MTGKLRVIWSLSDWRKRDCTEPPLIPVKDEPMCLLTPYRVIDHRLRAAVLENAKRRHINPARFKKGNQIARRKVKAAAA